MSDERIADIEKLAKLLAVAWWSAEAVLRGEPEDKRAAWFATEHVEWCWDRLDDEDRYKGGTKKFMLTMAGLLAPALLALPETEAEEWRTHAMGLWKLNGAGIRALRLAAVKWPGHEATTCTLVADMLEGKDAAGEGNRIIDVVIAAEKLLQGRNSGARDGERRWATLKRALDRLWTPK